MALVRPAKIGDLIKNANSGDIWRIKYEEQARGVNRAGDLYTLLQEPLEVPPLKTGWVVIFQHKTNGTISVQSKSTPYVTREAAAKAAFNDAHWDVLAIVQFTEGDGLTTD
jgi:hypothetical protein